MADPINGNPTLLHGDVPGEMLQRCRDEVWKIENSFFGADVDSLNLRCLSLYPDTPFAGHLGCDHTVQLV